MTKNFLKENWLIILIFFLALGLRLWGVNYGLPGLFVGDEKSLVGGALKMIFEKNIFPVFQPSSFRLLYYPVLIPWIYLIVFAPYVIFVYSIGNFASVSQIRDFFIMDPSSFFLMARVINTLFSAASVYIIYLIAKKIFSKRAGLIAALFYSVSWLPVHQGHFSKHWNIGMFFALFTLYFSILIIFDDKKRNYIKTGLMTGLASFANYVTALYGIVLLISHFLFRRNKLFDKRLWLFIFIVLLIFALAIITYPQEFHRLALGEDSTATYTKTLAGFWSCISEISRTLFFLATVILFFSLIGYIFLFFRDKKMFFLLVFIPLLSPFLYYFLWHFEPRYVLLFLPILVIVAGFGLDRLLELLKLESKFSISLICLVIIFIPLKNAIIFDRMLCQEDTRSIAKEWVENNIPKDSKIITNSWEFELIKNQECLDQQQKMNNMSLRSRDYVMMNYPFKDSYCVWNLDLIKLLPPDVEEYQYYLTDEGTTKRFGFLGNELMKRAELIKTFQGSPFDPTEQNIDMFVSQRLKDRRLGPTVNVYLLQ